MALESCNTCGQELTKTDQKMLKILSQATSVERETGIILV